MILKFLSRASVPFQPLNDKVSIFNTENTASSVHSQACHDGRICVENTQIYALLRRYLILQTLNIEHIYTHKNKNIHIITLSLVFVWNIYYYSYFVCQ